MSEKPNFRMERIERLLQELRYEVERGMMEREIDETLTFRFVVPISQTFREGVVCCEFHTRPAPRYMAFPFEPEGPRLKAVK